jgi:surface polysaccharide O-acyltransferase-like enzyme
MKAQRIYSIDVLRFFANFCIVLTHTRVAYTRPTENLDGLMLGAAFIVYNISRMALPFFFILSGFFYGKSLLKTGTPKDTYWKTFKKLLVVYFCCGILYALIPRNGAHFLMDTEKYGWLKTYYWYLQDLVLNSPFLILEGTKYHLWFIPALIIGLSVITAFHCAKQSKFLVYIFAISYLVMIALKPLTPQVIVGDDRYDFGGILKAVAYVTCGYLLAQSPRWEARTALKLIFAGVILLIIQNFWLWTNQIDTRSTVLAGILLCSVGIFMLALNYPDWGKDHFTSKFGLLTLWIYGVHPLILDQLEPLGQHIPPAIWNLTFPISVYTISLIFVMLVQRLLTGGRINTDKALSANLP